MSLQARGMSPSGGEGSVPTHPRLLLELALQLPAAALDDHIRGTNVAGAAPVQVARAAEPGLGRGAGAHGVLTRLQSTRHGGQDTTAP